ncbi:MAG: adenylate/guanylate cyclase domain-containing protein [Acidobacteriota bacterium]|nr:adenylate/guanylate cyclase domain-containing protein [Acidobacteriota bacterium]
MNRTIKRILICAAIVVGSVAATLWMENIQFFHLLDLKAQDAHFVLRGARPVRNIVIIGRDEKAEAKFPELIAFWQPYYADAMRAVAAGGGKVMVLDIAFGISVEKYVKDNDRDLAGAFAEVNPVMPVVCAFVPAAVSEQADAVPINMLSSTFGMAAYANLTVDSDDFVRRQELVEAPRPGVPTESLIRGMALRAAEKMLGQDVVINGKSMALAGRQIPIEVSSQAAIDNSDANDKTKHIYFTINFAGPADTFPKVSLYDVVAAYRNHDQAQLEKWFKGNAVLLGPDTVDDVDRHPTPFYTAFSLSKKWRTAGVEIHANALNTLLTGDYLKPVPEWAHTLALFVAAGLCIVAVVPLAVPQTIALTTVTLAALLVGTHVLFRDGWLLSTSQTMLAFGWSLIGGIVFRFATAEKKSSFLKNAVALFVGKQVAATLDQTEKISLEGDRRMVTILFTDIRGFTAFCESKDPAVVVELLNVYMSKMVSIIVKYHGHVNKFIGDGILAVFSDTDPGAIPGDHALRTVRAASEMVSEVVGEFRTGAGLHSGEVVIGNVGSSDKLEFTVLGNTVNLASRLESLNKDQKTRLLMSEEAREMLGGQIDTIYLGAVPVKGKTEKMKLFTVTSLLEESRVREILAQEGQPV